jgi:hypothetical protein
MMRIVRRTAIAALGALCAHTATLQAQGTLREQTQAITGSTPRRIVAINPFLPLAGSFQGEFEQRLRDNFSVAVSASYINLDGGDDRFANADVKLRLYPSENALRGFGIAAGLGVGRQSGVEYYACPAIYPGGNCPNQIRSATGPTFSVEMQYQWLLGKSRKTAVSVGGGAKRYFIDTAPNAYEVYEPFMPTLRLTIGYAFR